MANPEHLAILKKGVKAWNEWTEAHQDIWVLLDNTSVFWADLSGANLSEANLDSVDLRRVDLRRVDLSRANLVEANLVEADLSHANLSEATLTSANLRGTSLRGTDLRGANLEAANLCQAVLSDVNLHEADLSHANVSEATLTSANLRGASLRGTDLRGANLEAANLHQANLEAADLHEAFLAGANLKQAFLFDTNLCHAVLFFADLSRAWFRGANLREASFGFTVIANTDLSWIDGLDEVHHRYPSSIGIDTFLLSQGNIPEKFLRGAGVPDDLIAYANALVAKPIEFHSCFISYSSKDQTFADLLYADLQDAGVRCWFASEDMKIGDEFRDRIDESIRVYDRLLLVLSDNSISSGWVKREVEAAFEREGRQSKTVLFPIRLDDTVMSTDTAWAADIRRTRHIGDFTNWTNRNSYKKAFDRLLRDLRGEKTGE